MAEPTHRTMPRRGVKGAPSFSGTSATLERFIDDVEIAAKEVGLPADEWVVHAVRYVDPDIEMLWRGLPSYATKVWAEFKKEIRKLYPGLDQDRKFGVAELEKLVSNWYVRGIRTQEEMGQFNREFKVICDYLLNKERLSNTEADRSYWRVFSGELKADLASRMRTTAGKDHHPDDPYGRQMVYEQALLCLYGTSTGVSHFVGSSVAEPPKSERSVKMEEEMVKMMTTMSQLLTTVTSTFQANQNLGGNRFAPPGGQSGFNVGQAAGGSALVRNARSPTDGCLFCNAQGHFGRECPVASEYIVKGLAKRNAMNQICLPNGFFIPGAIQGACLRDRFDAYYRMYPDRLPAKTDKDTPPHLSANFVSVLEFQQKEEVVGGATIEEIVEVESETEVELEKARALLLELEKKQEKGKTTKKFDGVLLPPLGSARAGPGRDSRQAAPPPPPPPKPAAVTFSKPEKPGDTGPQFRFVSGMDDPKAVGNVVDRMMESPITLSGREVLAISPEARKLIREKVTTRKVGTGTFGANSYETLLQAGSAESAMFTSRRTASSSQDVLSSMKDSLPLRMVEVFLENRVQCEAILDQGAQFIAIWKDVWEATKSTLLSDRKIHILQLIYTEYSVKIMVTCNRFDRSAIW